MTLVSGDLRLVTNEPAAVSEVWVRAESPRLHGTAYVVDNNAHIQVQGGQVEFEAIPGPAVMILISGGQPTGQTVKLIIPDAATATLRECIEAVGLVEDGTADTLTRLAQEVAAAAANSFRDWEAVEASAEAAAESERNAKTSETNAAESESAAKISETNSATSETNAGGSASAAAASERNAKTSETNAKSSERNAATSETNATTAASDALVIKNSIPATVQSEVDTRVPPKVAEVIAADSTVVDAAAAAVSEHAIPVIEAETENIRWARGNVPASTSSLSELEDGSWSVASASLAGTIGLPESQIGDIHLRTLGGGFRTVSFRKISTATSPASMWINSTNASGAWQSWQRVSTAVDLEDRASVAYVDAQKWTRGLAGTSLTSLDSMADGVWRVQSSTVRNNLGLPGGFGNLTLMSAGSYRNALYQTHTGDLWTNAATNGVWVGWKQVPLTELTAPTSSWASTDAPWTGTNIDDAPQGIVTVWSGSAATSMGLPVGSMGVIQTVRFGNAATQNFYPVSAQGPQVWLRQNSGGGWTPWVQMGSSSGGGATVVQGISAAAGLKTVPLPLSLGRGNLQGDATGSYRLPVNYTPRIMRWRLGFSNTNPRYGTTAGNGLTIDQITVGDHAGEGAFTTTPTTVAENLAVPNDGAPAYTRWVGGDLGSGVDRLIGYTYTGQAGPPMLAGGGFNVGTSSADEVTPATATPVVDVPFDVWLEVEVAETVPVIAVIGDSITCGVGSTIPVHDAWGSVYMRQFGGLATLYGTSGDTGKSWTLDENRYKVSRFERTHLARPNAVVWAMGRNDFSGGTTATQMQAITDTAVDIITRRIGSPIFAVTVTPRRTGLGDAERSTYNRTLMQSEMFRQVFDFAEAVTTPDGALIPEYDADGLHFTTPGSHALAEAITSPITAPPVIYQTT